MPGTFTESNVPVPPDPPGAHAAGLFLIITIIVILLVCHHIDRKRNKKRCGEGETRKDNISDDDEKIFLTPSKENRRDSMLANIACIIIALTLAVGAYTDYKTRTIPNIIPIIIFACGFFTAVPWLMKIFSLVAIIILLILLRKKRSGGGDIKLYTSLCWAIGIPSFAVVLLLVYLAAVITTKLIRKDEKGKTIPLCTYMAPAFILYEAAYIIISKVIAV